MKKIILSAAAAFSALVLFMNNNAGAAPKTTGEAYKYAANDTIPKKDTIKKDSISTFHLQVK